MGLGPISQRAKIQKSKNQNKSSVLVLGFSSFPPFRLFALSLPSVHQGSSNENREEKKNSKPESTFQATCSFSFFGLPPAGHSRLLADPSGGLQTPELENFICIFLGFVCFACHITSHTSSSHLSSFEGRETARSAGSCTVTAPSFILNPIPMLWCRQLSDGVLLCECIVPRSPHSTRHSPDPRAGNSNKMVKKTRAVESLENPAYTCICNTYVHLRHVREKRILSNKGMLPSLAADRISLPH